jgi:DNA polymerase I
MGAVVVDTEWGFRDGRVDCETAFEPVVLCARVLPSGKDFSFPGRDDRLSAFVAAHRDHLWVAHSAVAELKYLLRLGIPLPAHWFCTMTAFRAVNNRPGYLSASLVDALNASGLSHLVPLNKDEIRNKILTLAFTPADIPAITDYCRADVIATAVLFTKLTDKVNPVAMTYWTTFLSAVARMELRGIPIDTKTLRVIIDNKQHIRRAWMDRANDTARVYRPDGSFDSRAFFKWAARNGILWPRRPSPATGRLYLPLDDETLKGMEGRAPFIKTIRETRKTIRTLSKFGIKVDGRDRRHYPSTMPFRSVTGRNQPRKFVFGGPKWLRWLVVPPSPGHVLIYIDFKAQEIGIAAALSKDPAMAEMYKARDPHIAFAIMAGAVPAAATKATHEKERDVYKTVNLGVLYGMTEFGIAERLGIDTDEAQTLLNKHRELFRDYHAWSDRVVSATFDRGYATTPAGWRAHVPPDSKPRTWANFPIQGGGADIMRVMTIGLDALGVDVLAIIHDGWLLSCRRGEQDRLRQAVEQASRMACDKVLGGFTLKFDWAEFADRFQDDKGREAWEFISGVLPKETIRVPGE